jgi:hypothetical protein
MRSDRAAAPSAETQTDVIDKLDMLRADAQTANALDATSAVGTQGLVVAHRVISL